jgi:hypothetical protein
MKTAIYCLLCFVLRLSIAQGAFVESDSGKDPICGKWLYHGQYTATISSDGTTSYPNGLKGTWRYLETSNGERKYQIDWKGGLYIEMFTLSKDGNTLDGINKQGAPIRAVRVEKKAKNAPARKLKLWSLDRERFTQAVKRESSKASAFAGISAACSGPGVGGQ